MNANLFCKIPTVLWWRLAPHCIKRIFFSIPHGNVGQVTNSLGSKFFVVSKYIGCPILWCFVEQNHQDTGGPLLNSMISTSMKFQTYTSGIAM